MYIHVYKHRHRIVSIHFKSLYSCNHIFITHSEVPFTNTHTQTNRQTGMRTHRHTDKQTNRQTDKHTHTDKQTHGTHGHTDKQTHGHTTSLLLAFVLSSVNNSRSVNKNTNSSREDLPLLSSNFRDPFISSWRSLEARTGCTHNRLNRHWMGGE